VMFPRDAPKVLGPERVARWKATGTLDVFHADGGMRPLKGKVAWIAGDTFGVRFEPVILEAGELLRLAGLDKAA